ncbi:NAD(P)/FAD-dependent oxidoreductase [Luteimonas sp. 50]|uniref:NAD(P)/FAD-dependent oxidoreductase n=1 Tax=Cognatiluteimonas sedimenti TaxID=2927791 RepID=A0ABT0A0S6_9GAMM|nr:NAD(P)/FAD-dependent oxidoreductase [Lysobacter sedimenti]
MCALTAGQRGKRVLVVEHANRVGKKILMSGGGRCNFTNLGAAPANYLSANPHFCKSALARYTPRDFIELVERHGIAYHEKEPGQLFCDVSSKLIVKMLLDECATAGVRIETSCSIERVGHGDAGFHLRTARGTYSAPALVVACGGLSIPSMGASGFGYALAQQFGHAVLPTRAGLVPLTLTGKHQERLADLSGVAFPVTARCNGAQFSNFMLLTHRGVSGPAILQVSSYWQPGDDLRLDLLPGQDALASLQRLRAARPAAELRTVLGELLPRRFAQRLCEAWLHALHPARPMRQFNDPQLREVAALLGDWPLVASGTEGYRTAEVTLGGVDTDGLSSSTMQSRHIPGLYFIGEVVDVTGWLGGYNFQWAWASGHAAGMAL